MKFIFFTLFFSLMISSQLCADTTVTLKVGDTIVYTRNDQAITATVEGFGPKGVIQIGPGHYIPPRSVRLINPDSDKNAFKPKRVVDYISPFEKKMTYVNDKGEKKTLKVGDLITYESYEGPVLAKIKGFGPKGVIQVGIGHYEPPRAVTLVSKKQKSISLGKVVNYTDPFQSKMTYAINQCDSVISGLH